MFFKWNREDLDWIWSISSLPKTNRGVCLKSLFVVLIHLDPSRGDMEELDLRMGSWSVKFAFFFFPDLLPPPFTETCQELRTLQESISQQKAERQAETSTMQLSLNEVSLRLEQLQQAGRGFEGFWPGHGRWVVGKHTVTSCWFGKWNLESGKVLELKKQKNINEWLSCNKSGTSEEHLESRLSLIPNLSKLSPSS